MTQSGRATLWLWATWWLGVSLSGAAAQPCRTPACAMTFPPGSGAVDVRDFGARGDGRTDDTKALRAAIAASGGDTGRAIWHDRLVYLPPGTYLVSDTLFKLYADGRFASGLALIGAGVDRTLLRLADNSPGFADPALPRAVVMTSSKRLDTGGGRDYEGRGEGNDAYENFVEAMTIDVGGGNPGAIAIDYLANNIGAIRNVRLRAPEGSGATGIAMRRRWPGPALIQDVAIEGFDIAIDLANTEYGMTLSDVVLTGQRRAGLRNAGNALAAERLAVSGGSGAAILNDEPGGQMTLVDATLATTGPELLRNRGILVMRNTRLDRRLPRPVTPAGRPLDGWLAGPEQWTPAPPGTWVLPHPPAPDPADDSAAKSIVVAPPAAGEEQADATPRLRAALAAGAPVIFLAHGTYWLSGQLDIPPGVHRILGMNATLRVLPRPDRDFAPEAGMLRISGAGSALVLSHLAFDNTGSGLRTAVVSTGARALVLRDVIGNGVTLLDRRGTGGPAFLEDVCCGLFKLSGPASVVARQLDTEGPGIRVSNDGAPLTVLGLKTEGFCTTIATVSAGRTEVLGGLIYVATAPAGPDRPAFLVQDATLRASFVEETLQSDHGYRTYLHSTVGNLNSILTADTTPPRGFGHLVPLLRTP